jgi:hypothetical protein
MLDLNFRITDSSIPLLALQSVRPDTLDRPAESVNLTVAAPLTELLADLRPALATDAGHDTIRTDNPIRQSTLQVVVFGDDPDDVTTRRRTLETRVRRASTYSSG